MNSSGHRRDLSLEKELTKALGTNRFGRSVEWNHEIDSTNRRALELAARDAPHGTLIVSDFQSSGRGRFQRKWIGEPGQNLMFSLVLRPTALDPEQLGRVTVGFSVAIREVLAEKLVSRFVSIKWPNDILLDEKKVCGLLLESTVQSDELRHVVIGVGLNVNQRRLPDELVESATSLRLASGRTFDRVKLLADLLLTLEERYEAVLGTRYNQISRRFEAAMEGIGQLASFRLPGQERPQEGIIVGLATNGGLRMMTDHGEVVLHGSEVTFATASPS